MKGSAWNLICRWFKPAEKGLFQITQQQGICEIKNTWIVAKQNTPTLDYYFRNRSTKFIGYKELCSENPPDKTHPIWSDPNAQVVLSRNVSLKWLQTLNTSVVKPASIIWFIDDDIPGITEDITLPKTYRKHLAHWYTYARPLLASLCTDVWVSTHYLAEKYKLSSANVLPPVQLKKSTSSLVKCFYHGTSSHTLEWRFIHQFVAAVQSQYEHTWFELIGDHSLKKMFEGIPRVMIIHPLDWLTYQALVDSRTMDIGLVPLFDSPFNLARSHTKMLDIQRQGAIGIYSCRFPLAKDIHNQQAGVVVEDGLENWLTAFSSALAMSRSETHQRAEQLIDQLESAY